MFLVFYRFMNGAASNPDAHIFAAAAAQVKKCMEVAKKLGAENFGNYSRLSLSRSRRNPLKHFEISVF